MENGQSVFSLSPHEARAVRAHKSLTPRVTDFFTDFEEKTDCFAVYKNSPVIRNYHTLFSQLASRGREDKQIFNETQGSK